MKTQMTHIILGAAFVAHSFAASAQGIRLNKLNIESCEPKAGLGIILRNDLGQTTGLQSLYLNSNQATIGTTGENRITLECSVSAQDQKPVIVLRNGMEKTEVSNESYALEIEGHGTTNLVIDRTRDAKYISAMFSKDGNEMKIFCDSNGRLHEVQVKSGATGLRSIRWTELRRLEAAGLARKRTSVRVFEQGAIGQAPDRCMTAEERNTYFAESITSVEQLEREIQNILHQKRPFGVQ